MMLSNLRSLAQEVRELGFKGTAFRVKWELEEALRPLIAPPTPRNRANVTLNNRRVCAASSAIADTADLVLPPHGQAALLQTARHCIRGRIPAFGGDILDYGQPLKWHQDPVSGYQFPRSYITSRAIRQAPAGVDIKFLWELGRFPQAYYFGRAAIFNSEAQHEFASAYLEQVRAFAADNPPYIGVHWSSGQEIALRSLALWFGVETLLDTRAGADLEPLIAHQLAVSADHIEHNLSYARHAVFNNHLLSEALGLLAIGTVVQTDDSERWQRTGRALLTEQVERQFYSDGSYIQQSHTYQRLALTVLLWACAFVRATKCEIPPEWLQAMARSLDFLYEQQDNESGWLPNYGANDGVQPSPLSCCSYEDFRPVLQAVSCVARGERLYEPGPWDEMAVWFLGPAVLDLPLNRRRRVSASFTESGYHTLRSEVGETFSVLRCGSLRDRFSQIDMLHLDVWWRGTNILVDAGSYSYNGAPEWHRHFMGTRAHNTIEVDHQSQMVHHRQFKVLYWTKAKLRTYFDTNNYGVMSGEHYGYCRTARCTHRRAVLFVKPDLWVICDDVVGSRSNTIRLQWQAAPLPSEWTTAECRLTLQTAHGCISLQVLDPSAVPRIGDVQSGHNSPPRGWVSRRYGTKTPAPSLAVSFTSELPARTVTVIGSGTPIASAERTSWTIQTEKADVEFTLSPEGAQPFDNVSISWRR